MRIMVSWGIVAALTGLVQDALQLYIARFILGLMEASFFPGIIVYLTHWLLLKKGLELLDSLCQQLRCQTL